MDVLSRKVDKEQDLKSWLDQLNKNGRSDVGQGNVDTSSRFAFDSILGELDDLEKQFDIENTDKQDRPHLTSIKPFSTSSHDQTRSNDKNMSQALEEFGVINSQLEDVLNDLAGFAGKPSVFVPIKQESPRTKPPPPPVPIKNQKVSQIGSKSREEHPSNDLFFEKAQSMTIFTHDSPVILSDSANKCLLEQEEDLVITQSYVNVHFADGSIMGFSVTSKTTVGDLYNLIMNELINCGQKYFTIWEVLPDLAMERELEEHLLVLDQVVNFWSKNSNNKILMKVAKLPNTPTNLKGDLKGTLHIKTEEKKSWKGYTFIMKPGGLFYYSKAKGKIDPICYLDLEQHSGYELFFGIGWKKKFKAPSEFGFAIKSLKVEDESEREVKYFCADSEALRSIWMLAIKQMLCKKAPNLDDFNHVSVEPISLSDDANHYSEPFETRHRFHSRRISNASTSSGKFEIDESSISNSVKKIANLPITTGTTRFLQSMQSTIPNQRLLVKHIGASDNGSVSQKDHIVQDKNQSNRHCLNEYAPSPYACKTQDVLLKSPQQKPNIIKTLPKPNRTLSQQSSIAAQDLPSLPSLMTHPPSQYQTLPTQNKSRSLPPPLPKRDHSTKLTSKPKEFHASIQTRNFILNLDRTIGQKRALGAEGLQRVEMPLPPPPVVSNEASYIDLGDLPPPPAELLQGLKCMRTNPGLFQPSHGW